MAEVKSNAQVALEVAIVQGTHNSDWVSVYSVTETAGRYLAWLNAHSDKVDLSK